MNDAIITSTGGTYKAKIRIPTDQYAFIEVDVNDTAENVALIYDEFKKQLSVGEGLLPKEFNRALDEFLKTGTLVDGTELYHAMSPPQQDIFQNIKRSLARIKYQMEKNEKS